MRISQNAMKSFSKFSNLEFLKKIKPQFVKITPKPIRTAYTNYSKKANPILKSIYMSRKDNSKDFWSFSSQVLHSVGVKVLHQRVRDDKGTNQPVDEHPLRICQYERNQAINGKNDRFGIGLDEIAMHCDAIYGVKDAAVDGIHYFPETVQPLVSIYKHGTDLAYSQYYPPPLDVYMVTFRGTVKDNLLQWAQNFTHPLGKLLHSYTLSTAADNASHIDAYNRLKSMGWDNSARGLVEQFVKRQLLLKSVTNKEIACSKDLNKSKYIFCGHSRGGLLSLLGASVLSDIFSSELEKHLQSSNSMRMPERIPMENVCVVGFGMPIIEPFNNSIVENISTISCFVHTNDIVGLCNEEKEHVDYHISASALSLSSVSEPTATASTSQSNDSAGMLYNLLQGVSSVATAAGDISARAHDSKTYLHDIRNGIYAFDSQ